MIRSWPLIRSSLVLESPIFKLFTKTCSAPHNHLVRDFTVLEAGNWVNVVAVTPEGRIVFVRQFRHGTREVTTEIPGGLVDPGQTPFESAVRELREETGFASDRWSLLGRNRPNPAFLNNWCYTYLAVDARQQGDPTPEETEDLETVFLTADEVRQAIRDGVIDHSLVLTAFFFYFSENVRPTSIPGEEAA